MITQAYDINLIPEYNSVPVVVHVSQYDSGSRILTFNLLNGDTVFTPSSDASATIEGTKPDGHSFSYTAAISGSTVSAPVTLQMAAVAGNTRCELRILDSTGILGTANFIIAVEVAGVSENPDMSDTDLPGIITIATRQMEQAMKSADEALVSQEAAAESEEHAGESSLQSEAWATGRRGGTDVEETDETYHNNSKYYSEESLKTHDEMRSDYAEFRQNLADDKDAYADELGKQGTELVQSSEAWATGRRGGKNVPETDETYHNNSQYYSERSESTYAEMRSDYAGFKQNLYDDKENYSRELDRQGASLIQSSEAWAVGEKGGEAVDPGDETYHNNAKHYSRQSEISADAAKMSETRAGASEANACHSESNAEAWAVGQRFGADVGTDDETYRNNSKWYSQQTAESVRQTAENAEESEAWAVGKRGGADVGTDDETYRNNSKYYADRTAATAAQAAGLVADAQGKIDSVDGIIQDALDDNVPSVWIDFETGQLMWEGGSFVFTVNNSTGNLEWRVAA